MLGDIFRFLLDTLFTLLGAALVARAWMHAVRMHPFNAVVRFIYQATNWLVNPLRRLLPSQGRVDYASIVGAWLTALVVAVMMALAAREVAARPKARLTGHGNGWVGTLAVASTTLITALFILSTALRPDPWYDPRYTIALVGIVLGSVLNAASLALDGMLSGVRRERLGIEARLALGATVHQAFASLLRESVRRGIVPSINQMSAAGIITLPGIMTGQIIAGMDPVDAAKYQILLMFLLCGASGLAAMGAAWLAMRRLTDARDRLRLDRLLPERAA